MRVNPPHLAVRNRIAVDEGENPAHRILKMRGDVRGLRDAFGDVWRLRSTEHENGPALHACAGNDVAHIVAHHKAPRKRQFVLLGSQHQHPGVRFPQRRLACELAHRSFRVAPVSTRKSTVAYNHVLLMTKR